MAQDYFELREELNRKQREALERSFNAAGRAWGADLGIPKPYVLDMMDPSKSARLVSDALLEVIREELEEARADFIRAGEEFAFAAKERREELEEGLFAQVRELPLSDRVAAGEKSEEDLLRLLNQSYDSNDDEMTSYVLLAAHVGEHPRILDKIFQLNEELGDLYHEWREIPSNEQLEGYSDEFRWARMSRAEPDLTELHAEARRRLSSGTLLTG